MFKTRFVITQQYVICTLLVYDINLIYTNKRRREITWLAIEIHVQNFVYNILLYCCRTTKQVLNELSLIIITLSSTIGVSCFRSRFSKLLKQVSHWYFSKVSCTNISNFMPFHDNVCMELIVCLKIPSETY